MISAVGTPLSLAALFRITFFYGPNERLAGAFIFHHSDVLYVSRVTATATATCTYGTAVVDRTGTGGVRDGPDPEKTLKSGNAQADRKEKANLSLIVG